MTDGSYTMVTYQNMLDALQICRSNATASYEGFVCQRLMEHEYAPDLYTSLDVQHVTGSLWREIHRTLLYFSNDTPVELQNLVNDMCNVAAQLYRKEDPRRGKNFLLKNSAHSCPSCGSHDFECGFSFKGQRILQCDKCKKWQVRKVKVSSNPVAVSRTFGDRIRDAWAAFWSNPGRTVE